MTTKTKFLDLSDSEKMSLKETRNILRKICRAIDENTSKQLGGDTRQHLALDILQELLDDLVVNGKVTIPFC